MEDVPRIGKLKGRYGAPTPAPAIVNPALQLAFEHLIAPQG